MSLTCVKLTVLLSTSALQTCLEQLSTKVCDPSGVLNQEQMQKLNDALGQMEKQTEQACS